MATLLRRPTLAVPFWTDEAISQPDCLSKNCDSCSNLNGILMTTAADIADWLTSLGLGEYSQRFAEDAIDLSVIGDLTEQDLKELGVSLGHRRKMLSAIAELHRTTARKPDTAARFTPRGDAERRQLTVMFCDIVGSTALSARLDPEDTRKVLGAYHARIAKVIGEHHGIVSRYLADGVLAYFGYPQAHEDDAEQSVRAGLALVDAVADLQTTVNGALHVRIGIATGTVVVGNIFETTVIGDTPNLAARLQTLAEAGTVAVCANTRRLTEGYFQYRDLGSLSLKGWAEPASAWQVLGPSGVESRFQALHKNKLAPLLGRDEEIELLLRRWQHAIEGEGRIVMLTGEPGIGKSHIALALSERLQDEAHITLSYFCFAHHANSALFPFMSQLERAARFERGDSPAQKLTKLETILQKSAADADHVAILASLLSVALDDRHRLPELTPQKRKERTLAALLSQLDGLAARQPVLIIFEDAHWIDPTSLELLTAMVERVRQLPVLLLITARPEFTPPWPEHAETKTISLTRLNRRHGASLVARVAGGKALPEEVMNQILVRTDGVPLFVEELTKAVLESGVMREQDDQYVLEQSLPSSAIPTTLHASLTARLDRLADVKDVAQIAAVIGREFSYELLNAVAGLPRETLEDALGQLVRSELIFRRGEIPRAVYTFKHALVRDAAYGGLLKSRRAELHAAIAGALERQFPEIAKQQPETLAHHFTEAGLIDKAAGYWLNAGKIAALRSANIEAIAHLQAGIDAAARLPHSLARDRLELDLVFAQAPCLIAIQGPASSKAVATFARARQLCERLGDPPEYLQVMFWLTTASVVRGELPQAHEGITTLLRLAKARSDQPALLNALRGQGMIFLFMGNVVEAQMAIERAIDAFDASEEAERLAARSAGQDAGVANLSLMSWALWVRGGVDEAVVRIDAALQRADLLQHPHTQAYAYYYASVLHGLRGEPTIAYDRAKRCLALSEEHGFKQWLGLARAVQGICAAVTNGSSNTFGEVTTAVDEYRRRGYQLGVTALYVLLCPALLHSHQPAAALEVIDQGLLIARHNGERVFEAELNRLKARALLLNGAPDAGTQDAQTFLSEALLIARSQHARSLELRAARDLAALWLDQGRGDEARQLLTPVYAAFTEGFATQDLMEAKAVLDRLR